MDTLTLRVKWFITLILIIFFFKITVLGRSKFKEISSSVDRKRIKQKLRREFTYFYVLKSMRTHQILRSHIDVLMWIIGGAHDK